MEGKRRVIQEAVSGGAPSTVCVSKASPMSLTRAGSVRRLWRNAPIAFPRRCADGGQSAVILGWKAPFWGVTRRRFLRGQPLRLYSLARNITDPVQLTALTADLRACVGADVPVLIDQEGGRVQRMRAPHWREWLPPLEQAALASDPIRAAWLRARIMAAELRACGVDANCAPTCDIAGALTHPFLRNRCWGEDVATVTPQARATMDGFWRGRAADCQTYAWPWPRDQ